MLKAQLFVLKPPFFMLNPQLFLFKQMFMLKPQCFMFKPQFFTVKPPEKWLNHHLSWLNHVKHIMFLWRTWPPFSPQISPRAEGLLRPWLALELLEMRRSNRSKRSSSVCSWGIGKILKWELYIYIWVNFNISLTWIKAIWGWFPLLTMIPVRS